MNSIGDRISETRKAKGLTQDKLAELSQVNLRTIQRIENNENEPRGKTLELICSVLDLNVEEILDKGTEEKRKDYGILIINVFFLFVLNFALMGIYGYLTLASGASINSRLGAYLLSFFIPIFIVWKTPKISGMERMLKFGTGLIFYILVVLVNVGFPTGFVTGLLGCLVIALGVLFYGNAIIKLIE
jgi:transcriptional regulator with XRE-family HTH domain